MLDIQFIRENENLVAEAIKNKGSSADLKKLLEFDGQRRQLTAKLDDLRAKRNQMAKQSTTSNVIKAGKQLRQEINDLEASLTPIQASLDTELYKVPNIPSDDTPVGDSEDQNITLTTWGQKPVFDFGPKPHWEFDRFIDEPRATRISGKRFAFIKGGLVKLQLSLVQYGLDVLTNSATLKLIADRFKLPQVSTKPFAPVLPPVMMRTEAYKATGRLKPEEVTFKLANNDLWLTGSSEHTMCAYYMGETLDESELPLRLVGYNTAFRREVGSDGKDTRGIIRQHQFDKLEMESFTTPDKSRLEHEFMIAIQQYLVQQLEMPYRLVHKCTYDMGDPNIRGVDLETWMAGQGVYRETHTADYLGDYQARGLGTKFQRNDSGAKELVHTNDATAFAQRTLIAILENNQTADGRVKVPEVLKTYMLGREYIE